MNRLGNSAQRITASSKGAELLSHAVRPMVLVSCMARWTLGRRRSPSTSRTRLPNRARAMAVFIATVVLPSEGSALVIMITAGGVGRESRIEVSKARYDSAAGDNGCKKLTNSGLEAVWGTLPSTSD